MIDGEQIIVSSTFNTNKIKLEYSTDVQPQIYINGKDIMEHGGGSTSEAKVVDNSTFSFLNEISPQNNEFINLTGDIHIKIVYDKIQTQNQVLKGKWIFEFTTNKDKIPVDTKTIPINRNFITDKGLKITIKDLRISPIATKLDYAISDSLNYVIDFNLQDESGKEIPFVSGNGGSYSQASPGSQGVYCYDILSGNITKLKITPVLKAMKQPKEGSHEETVDYKRVLVEETFEIKVK